MKRLLQNKYPVFPALGCAALLLLFKPVDAGNPSVEKANATSVALDKEMGSERGEKPADIRKDGEKLAENPRKPAEDDNEADVEKNDHRDERGLGSKEERAKAAKEGPKPGVVFVQEDTAAATFQKAFDELKSIHAEYNRLRKDKTKSADEMDRELEVLRDRGRALYESLIDLEFVGRLALGKDWDRISGKKRDKFTEDFRTIIRAKFSSNEIRRETKKKAQSRKKLARFSKMRIKKSDMFYDRIFLKRKVDRIRGVLPGDEVDTDVDFLMVHRDGRYIIYDLYLDGNSLVNDYRNQFHRIIRKEGLDGLLKKLETKAATMKKELGKQ